MGARLRRLHVLVDEAALPIAELHRERLQCRRGCADCCVDGLGVFEVEAEVIAREHAELLAYGTPHPEGACAFLDVDGSCRIYQHRPYVCRTQGLPLRWLDEGADEEPVERRDICPLNDHGEPLELLPAEACWTLGPFEQALRELQAEGGRALRRVELRSLFAVGQASSSTTPTRSS